MSLYHYFRPADSILSPKCPLAHRIAPSVISEVNKLIKEIKHVSQKKNQGSYLSFIPKVEKVYVARYNVNGSIIIALPQRRIKYSAMKYNSVSLFTKVSTCQNKWHSLQRTFSTCTLNKTFTMICMCIDVYSHWSTKLTPNSYCSRVE